jgi:hypothetical protein
VEASRLKPEALLPTADEERLAQTNAAKLDWISFLRFRYEIT